MMPAIDLTGHRYNRMRVIRRVANHPKKGKFWECLCDCGNTKIVLGNSLRMGYTKSCGCLHREMVKAANTTHGLSETLEFNSWDSMMQRCCNPKSDNFPHYGMRGVKVCDFLKASPLNLIFIIGLRPEKHTLDRINTFLNYSCGRCEECLKMGWGLNVRWSTSMQQAQNTRVNHPVTLNGETHCVSEWARRLQMPVTNFRYKYLGERYYKKRPKVKQI